jgi:hypothetical protein
MVEHAAKFPMPKEVNDRLEAMWTKMEVGTKRLLEEAVAVH